MNGMKFVFPTPEYKARAIDYIAEMRAHGSGCNGCAGLENYLDDSTYEAWLDKVRSDIDVANVPDDRVPALTYFYVREADERIVGIINIRLALNDFLRTEAGHIGYCVRPAERQKHYATEMLREAVRVCGVLGIGSVIVTCDKENIGSARTILNCGGALDAEFVSDYFGETIQRYIISTK